MNLNSNIRIKIEHSIWDDLKSKNPKNKEDVY